MDEVFNNKEYAKYNKGLIDKVISAIKYYDGIGDKDKLKTIIQKTFGLTPGSVYYCDDLAIRFATVNSVHGQFSNNIISLKTLLKYDDRPFITCVVYPDYNAIYITNTTFIKKVSNTSKGLTIDHIVGTFTGSDIVKNYEGIQNIPSNFKELYCIHQAISPKRNLERIVNTSSEIVPKKKRVCYDNEARRIIMDSIKTANGFIHSKEYTLLKNDLDSRVADVEEEISLAVRRFSNNKLRGNTIEFLITSNDFELKHRVIKALHENSVLPQFKLKDDLGDYSKKYLNYTVEVDIKSKIMFEGKAPGNPKVYSVDKLLDFLTNPKSVFLIYFVGVMDDGTITTRLCSIYDRSIIESTRIEDGRWIGRDMRGTAQFLGNKLSKVFENEGTSIDYLPAEEFLNRLIDQGE